MRLRGIVLLLVITIADNQLYAQQNPPPGKEVSEEELKRANDPMANVKAFNIQDYIVSKLYGLQCARWFGCW